MSDPLTPSEADFARWMDELDLEEVNLLGDPLLDSSEPIDSVTDSAAPDSKKLDGERREIELPKSKNVGWDAE
jgi:hypothetical protein